jgi:hypothetical protein
MHAGSGQTALEAAGLLDAFLAASRPEGQDGRLLTHDGSVLFEHVAAPDEAFNPEIDRGDLRRLLLDPLHPGTVRWGAELSCATSRTPDPHPARDLATRLSHDRHADIT